MSANESIKALHRSAYGVLVAASRADVTFPCMYYLPVWHGAAWSATVDGRSWPKTMCRWLIASLGARGRSLVMSSSSAACLLPALQLNGIQSREFLAVVEALEVVLFL